MNKLYVIGIGPGGKEHMTFKAVEAIKESKAIVGYTPYIEYLGDWTDSKEIFSTGMRGELERCKKAINLAQNGVTTSIISTGDAGLYGMAGPILELSKDIEIEVQIIPGVTAAFSAASELGSPIMHDYVSISLSDLMTPLEIIYKRVKNSAEADMVIAIYNPRSKGRPNYLKNAIDLIMRYRSNNTPVGLVKNSGRIGTEIEITTLDNIDYNKVDMLTIVLIGNSNTYIEGNKIITPRGYNLK